MNSQPLIEVPNIKIPKPLHGLDAFTKTYYHLPAGIGVVDERGMTEEMDANTLAKEVEETMEDCREKVCSVKNRVLFVNWGKRESCNRPPVITFLYSPSHGHPIK